MAQAAKPNSSAALPATIPTALRALEEFRGVPPGHITVPVRGEAAPHLAWGEFAVVDTNDREPMNGELYLCAQQSSDGPNYYVNQLRRDDYDYKWQDGSHAPGWWLGPMNRSVLLCSDGPMLESHMRTKLIGRVVGFYKPVRTA